VKDSKGKKVDLSEFLGQAAEAPVETDTHDHD
jgi:hypothetical protein